MKILKNIKKEIYLNLKSLTKTLGLVKYIKFSVKNNIGNSSINNSLIVNENNFVIDHNIFYNNIKYQNIDNIYLSIISYLKNPYYDYKNINLKNSLNSSAFFPDKINITIIILNIGL